MIEFWRISAACLLLELIGTRFYVMSVGIGGFGAGRSNYIRLLIRKEGVVTEPIDPENSGMMKISGESWRE